MTNANFEHFWLNEGFATFVEGKIVGRLYGESARDLNAMRYLHELHDSVS